MRIVFFGTGTFAVPTLKVVQEHVALVVTQPDRPSGRGLRLQPSPVNEAAVELGLEVATPEKSRALEFVQRLVDQQSDFLLVASYGQILSQSVLDSAKNGGINLHGSILPKYRGAAPIQRAILSGEKETGVTLMQMDKGMDTGDIIDLATTFIGPGETYGQLQDRLAAIAAVLAQNWLARIVEGNYPRAAQDSSLATIASKVEKGEAELRAERSVTEEYNRFRAFTPAPGAYIKSSAGLLKISQARLSDLRGEPGTVLAAKDRLVVGFLGGGLELLELQPEGKKRMSGRDFANGARLKPGNRLI